MLSLCKNPICLFFRNFFDFLRDFDEINAAFVKDEDVIMHDNGFTLP